MHVPGPGLTLDAVTQSESEQQQLMEDSAAKVSLMPEYLIVCCWRSIKEVSLLLGQLTQMAPIAEGTTHTAAGLLTVTQVCLMNVLNEWKKGTYT